MGFSGGCELRFLGLRVRLNENGKPLSRVSHLATLTRMQLANPFRWLWTARTVWLRLICWRLVSYRAWSESVME